MATDFSMVAGNDRTLRIVITNAQGQPEDMSDASAVRFGAFRHDEQVLLKTLGNGIFIDGDTVQVELVPEDTKDLLGDYVIELDVTYDGKRYTAFQGTMTIRKAYLP